MVQRQLYTKFTFKEDDQNNLLCKLQAKQNTCKMSFITLKKDYQLQGIDLHVMRA